MGIFDNIIFDEFTILESIDKSSLSKSFKKKENQNIKYFDLKDTKIKNYFKYDNSIKEIFNWIDSNKDEYSNICGEIAIDIKENKFAGYILISNRNNDKLKNFIHSLYR